MRIGLASWAKGALGDRAGVPAGAASPAWAIVAAIPPALAVVIAADMARLPLRLLRTEPAQEASALFWLLTGCLVHLWGPLLFQSWAAMLQLVRPRRRWARVARAAACFALAGGLCWTFHRTAAAYSALASFPPLNAALALLGLGLGAWLARFGAAGPVAGGTPWPRLLARLGPPFALAACSAVALVLNRRFYRDSYLEVHLLVTQVGYALLHAALASLVAAAPRVPSALARALWALLAVAITLALLAMPIVSSRTGAKARGPYARRTVLGTSGALLPADPFAVRRAEGFGRPQAVEDRRGVPRFRKSSGMPQLDESLSIDGLNLLLVSMEAVRWDATSLADPRSGHTPELAAFAADGAFWFSRAYTPSPVTVQVFSSLFSMTPTSMTDFDGGEQPWLGELAAGAVTVPERLRAAGYHTFWIGHGLTMRGIGQGFDAVKRFSDPLHDAGMDEKIAERAIEKLRRTAASGERFFGWVFFASPHMYYYPHYGDMPAETDLDRYRQELRFGDGQLGRLIRFLRESGLLEQTIVVFLGDHGEEFGEHGGAGHIGLFEETVHVPLVVRVPGVAGGRIDAPVSTAYLFPWLLQHGAAPLREAAEESKRRVWGPLLEATDAAPVIERIDGRLNRAALVHGRHQVIYDFNSQMYELYDLVRDPSEKDDLFDASGALGREFGMRVQRYLGVREALRRCAERK